MRKELNELLEEFKGYRVNLGEIKSHRIHIGQLLAVKESHMRCDFRRCVANIFGVSRETIANDINSNYSLYDYNEEVTIREIISKAIKLRNKRDTVRNYILNHAKTLVGENKNGELQALMEIDEFTKYIIYNAMRKDDVASYKEQAQELGFEYIIKIGKLLNIKHKLISDINKLEKKIFVENVNKLSEYFIYKNGRRISAFSKSELCRVLNVSRYTIEHKSIFHREYNKEMTPSLKARIIAKLKRYSGSYCSKKIQLGIINDDLLELAYKLASLNNGLDCTYTFREIGEIVEMNHGTLRATLYDLHGEEFRQI